MINKGMKVRTPEGFGTVERTFSFVGQRHQYQVRLDAAPHAEPKFYQANDVRNLPN